MEADGQFCQRFLSVKRVFFLSTGACSLCKHLLQIKFNWKFELNLWGCDANWKKKMDTYRIISICAEIINRNLIGKNFDIYTFSRSFLEEKRMNTFRITETLYSLVWASPKHARCYLHSWWPEVNDPPNFFFFSKKNIWHIKLLKTYGRSLESSTGGLWLLCSGRQQCKPGAGHTVHAAGYWTDTCHTHSSGRMKWDSPHWYTPWNREKHSLSLGRRGKMV